MFPQDVDMASRLPKEITDTNDIQVPQEGNNSMEGVQVQQPHQPETVPIENVLTDEDLGPDFLESELPKIDLYEASKRCVDRVYLKYGFSIRTEEPQYESCALTLLDALEKRFGFVMPRSPDSFVARAPPKKCFAKNLLGEVIGMTDIGAQLASHKGLADIVSTFFGQCMEARFVNDIDTAFYDFHHGDHVHRPLCPFRCSRELLKSMRNPAQEAWYFVLRRPDSGIGSEVLLIPRATDFLEVLRQQWGPDIKDVAQHLLARGIPFWLAYISAEIMPEGRANLSGVRHKGFKADITTGLGFRPLNYEFDKHDYNAYTTRRDLRLLHTPRGRVALQYGGIMARLARSEVPNEDFFCGFSAEIYDVGDCLWDGTSQYAYWHDVLSDNEIDLLCGVYHLETIGMWQIPPISY
jgi:hypothetical protein